MQFRMLDPPDMTSTPHTRQAGGLSAALLIAQFGLIWTTFLVLSSAIGWPASLDDPAAVTLPRLIVQATPVFIGYGCYLLAALLLVPASAALTKRLDLGPGLSTLLVALAALSALAKTIGISRWLFAMPGLAQAYVAPGADQPTITLLFDTLNAYAGGIGEVIGVGLVTGVWTILVGTAVFRFHGAFAKGLGAYTLLAGASLFLTIPAGFGVELGPVLTISNIAWQFALLGVGLWAVLAKRGA